jgi:hypothetical protein
VNTKKRILIFLSALALTVFVCIFSARFNRAAHASILFERCEEPITFGVLSRIALGLDYASSGSACINNLRQIDGAKQTWALENNKPNNEVVTWKNIAPYMGRSGGTGRVWCPSGGVYRLRTLEKAPTCSIPGHELR